MTLHDSRPELDQWRTDPPQTVSGPHDRMSYFGPSGGTECMRCQDCSKVVPFVRAAEHQATHDTPPELDDDEEFDVTPAYYPSDFEDTARMVRGIGWGLLWSVGTVVVVVVSALVVFWAAVAVVSAIVTGASS